LYKAAHFKAEHSHEGTPVTAGDPLETKRITGKLLMFDQRWSASVHCAQRGKVGASTRSRSLELGPPAFLDDPAPAVRDSRRAVGFTGHRRVLVARLTVGEMAPQP
jgi:hypothetical protein